MTTTGFNAVAIDYELRLHSPAGADAVVFEWPMMHQICKNRCNGVHEIAETIRLVCEDIPEVRQKLETEGLNYNDRTGFNDMRALCEKFNSAIDSLLRLKGTSEAAPRLNERPSREILRHILQQVYNRSVTEPEKLNCYEPFSPEVYGETSFDLVCQMIDQIEISSDDTFVDLGSGVGQVVLQMAASTNCKDCLGIEKAEIPSAYAIVMQEHFSKWMNWFGKKCGSYEIIKGDFLDDDLKERITRASIVFVNNYSFGPTVDHKLKEILVNLKDGSKIVSSKAFGPLKSRISDRNFADIGSILDINELPPLQQTSVSWTNSPVSFYIHRMDRTKLERYCENKKATAGSKRAKFEEAVGNPAGRFVLCTNQSRAFNHRRELTSTEQDRVTPEKKYEDKAFPAVMESIYGESGLKFSEKIMGWKLIEALAPETLATENNSFRFEDVVQGCLKDCGLLAAICSLTPHESIWQRIFQLGRLPGSYVLHIYDSADYIGGDWHPVDVTVDGFVPCTKSGAAFARVTGGSLIPPMIEKAIAKLRGNYAELDHISVMDCFGHLLGNVKKDFLYLTNKNYTEDEIWEKIISLGGWLKVATTWDRSPVPTCSRGHCFTVMDAIKLHDEFRLVKLRNPYGGSSGFGDWTLRSVNWNKVSADERLKLKPTKEQAEAGIFYVSFEMFRKMFAFMTACEARIITRCPRNGSSSVRMSEIHVDTTPSASDPEKDKRQQNHTPPDARPHVRCELGDDLEGTITGGEVTRTPACTTTNGISSTETDNCTRGETTRYSPTTISEKNVNDLAETKTLKPTPAPYRPAEEVDLDESNPKRSRSSTRSAYEGLSCLEDMPPNNIEARFTEEPKCPGGAGILNEVSGTTRAARPKVKLFPLTYRRGVASNRILWSANPLETIDNSRDGKVSTVVTTSSMASALVNSYERRVKENIWKVPLEGDTLIDHCNALFNDDSVHFEPASETAIDHQTKVTGRFGALDVGVMRDLKVPEFSSFPLRVSGRVRAPANYRTSFDTVELDDDCQEHGESADRDETRAVYFRIRRPKKDEDCFHNTPSAANREKARRKSRKGKTRYEKNKFGNFVCPSCTFSSKNYGTVFSHRKSVHAKK